LEEITNLFAVDVLLVLGRANDRPPSGRRRSAPSGSCRAGRLTFVSTPCASTEVVSSSIVPKSGSCGSATERATLLLWIGLLAARSKVTPLTSTGALPLRSKTVVVSAVVVSFFMSLWK